MFLGNSQFLFLVFLFIFKAEDRVLKFYCLRVKVFYKIYMYHISKYSCFSVNSYVERIYITVIIYFTCH